jgi:hypothetical protein
MKTIQALNTLFRLDPIGTAASQVLFDKWAVRVHEQTVKLENLIRSRLEKALNDNPTPCSASFETRIITDSQR